MSFTIRYPGSCCAACDEKLKVGAEAAYDLEGDLIHVECPALVHEPRQLCPLCFMELPVNGKCDCRD